MDKQELLTSTFLTEYIVNLGLHRVKYEPIHNEPPDFSIDDRIGVEVTRLTNVITTNTGSESGVENLICGFEKLIFEYISLQEETDEESWLLSITLKRPLEVWGLFNEVKNILIEFKNSKFREEKTFIVRFHLTIHLKPSGIRGKKFYLLKRYLDEDRSGWITSKVVKNLQRVVKKKKSKIHKNYLRFSEWWLVLVDYIDPTYYSEQEVSDLEIIVQNSVFDKVFILDKDSTKPKFIYTKR